MERIPVECLNEIFKFLSIKDRINCRRVCKRWQTAISFNDTTQIDVIKDLEWSTSNCTSYPHICDNCDFTRINCLNGTKFSQGVKFFDHFRYLSTIVFAGNCTSTMVIKESVVGQLEKICDRIKRLHFVKIFLSEKCVLSVFTNIEEFELDGVNLVDERNNVLKNVDAAKYSLQDLCRHSRKLRVLKLADLDTSFEIVSETLEELWMKKLSQTNQDLYETCQNCPKLNSVRVNQCYELTDYSCLSLCKSLKTLSLVYCNVNDEDLRDICTNSKQLESVHIELCPLKDYQTISTVNRLTFLHLGPSAYITKDALHMIFSQCQKITGLKLQTMALVKPDELTKLIIWNCPKVKFLSLTDMDITNVHLTNILKHCCRLSHLETGRTKINDDFLLHVGTTKNALTKYWISEKVHEKSVITLALSRLMLFDRKKLDWLKLYMKFKNGKSKQTFRKYDDLLIQSRLFVSNQAQEFTFY